MTRTLRSYSCALLSFHWSTYAETHASRCVANLQSLLPVAKFGVDTAQNEPVFNWIQGLGDIDQEEMERVFNMGLGLAMVISPFYAESIRSQLSEQDIESWVIGEIIDGTRGVSWKPE